ncbi:peptidase S8 [Nocardioides sp. S5]|uniref:S8 family peptidase n=1 Tax=Nocardioides sp. S5 TaxID=2017486 RepID=UPI001A8C8F8C|nr:S8 family peptidase [Nocardioides sp. S5]QSR30800.1 peptidase S8 [Nocardioides sp. S5]
MSGDQRPLLALGAPEVGERIKQTRRDMPRLSKVPAARQGQRMSPQFRALSDAFDARRAELSHEQVDEVDPALVLVFDLAGTVEAFGNAVNKIEGLEFLAELLDEPSEPDDDFHMVQGGARTDNTVQHSLYLVMSNATAVTQLVSLFEQWQRDPNLSFERGLGKFKTVFEQLRGIRRWGPDDRVRETGLLERWQETVAVVGQSISTVNVEIELWYRRDPAQRNSAESHLRAVVERAGGAVTTQAQIDSISYHALLVALPIQQVETVLREGTAAIDLLNADEIMFVSPYIPMSVTAPETELLSSSSIAPAERVTDPPRIALLDGLPFQNHDALAGRLIIDDPDGIGSTYGVANRHHGTAMASLILHGDLSKPGDPLARPIYVRPILQPHPLQPRQEVTVQGRLLADLLHRAVRRIVEGDGTHPPAAPSVRIVNLSIGAQSRALVRRMSPLGRLLDWMSVDFNLLFVVSAGNHPNVPIVIPADSAATPESTAQAALKAVYATSKVRGILPPGDAVNALTVSATHADESGEVSLPDTVWDLAHPDAPALYGAVGPGVGRSVKPDVYHAGGRALYQRPVVMRGSPTVELVPVNTASTGPGSQVAAPAAAGRTDATAYTHGTSNATALVTREASRIFDILEVGRDSADDAEFPDPQYHPVLAKALLVHTSTWGQEGERLRAALGLHPQRWRRELTAVLGYGAIRPERIASAATNRAVLIAGGSLGREHRHTYEIPLPASLRAKAEWHRVTATVASFVPTAGHLNRYRGAKVFFERLDDHETGGARIEADHNATRRGSVQHEISDGQKALVFNDGGALQLHVQCMDDAQRLKAGRVVRYGLVVSVETAITTSTTIHDEARAQLRARVRAAQRNRIQP